MNIRQLIQDGVKDITPCTRLVDECLWDYNKSILCFWIWDFEKMVKDKESYNKYYKENE